MDNESYFQPGESFQRQVFELVSHRLRRMWPGSVLTITDNVKSGPIDVVATIKRKNDKLQLVTEETNEIEERIYIECKDYARKLSLDATGKAFCCALIDRPDYLIIASRHGLQPQALESAAALFRCSQITNLVVGDNQEIQNKPLTSIDFFHYTLNELLSGSANKKLSIRPERNPSYEGTKLSFHSWALRELFPTEREIATDKSNHENPIYLDEGSSYVFKLTLECFGKKIPNIDDLKITISDEKNNYEVKLRSIDTDLESFLTMDFHIDNNLMSLIANNTNLQVTVRHFNGKTTIGFDLPKIQKFENQRLLSGINGDIEIELYNFSRSLRHHGITIIEGGAGSGKTTLVRNVRNRLTIEGNYQSIELRLHDGDVCLHLSKIIRELMRHKVSGFSEPMKFVGEEATRYWIKSLLPEDAVLEEDISEKQLDDYSKNTLLSICSHALSNVERNIILILQDAHESSAETLNYLDQLLRSLSFSSNSKICTFVEWRTGDKDASSLKEVKSKLSRNFELEKKYIVIPELTKRQVTKSISQLFVDHNVLEMANSLFKKAGGNPFFIEQVLRHMKSKEYIDVSANKHGNLVATVKDHEGIRRELSGFDGDVINFLEYRLESLFGETFYQNMKARNLIILLSLCIFKPSRKTILYALELTEEDLNAIYCHLVNENILAADSLLGKPEFVHDLMRASANNLKLNTNNSAILARMETSLNDSSSENCLILGYANTRFHSAKAASKWFDQGQELSRKNNYFMFRLHLEGLDKCLATLDYQAFSGKVRHLDVKFDLGWSEFQSGSKIESRNVYKMAKDMASWPFDPLDSNSRRIEHAYVNKALHMLITVDVELLNLKEALLNSEEVIGKLKDSDLLFHVSNRLLLISMLIGDSKSIIEISGLCYDLACKCSDDGALSVVASDIGSALLGQYPELSRHFWVLGLETAHDLRQHLHSCANIQTVNLCTRRSIDRIALNGLLTEVQNAGLDGQLSRLYVLSGVDKLISGNLNEAEDDFSAAINCSSKSDNTIYIWISIYNLVITKIIADERENCQKYLEFIEKQLNDFEIDCKNCSMTGAKYAFLSACDSLDITENALGLIDEDLTETGPITLLTTLTNKLLKNYFGEKSHQDNMIEDIKSSHYVPIKDDLGCVVL